MIAAAKRDAPFAGRSVGIAPTVAIAIFLWAVLSLAAGYRWFGTGRDYADYSDWYGGLSDWGSATNSRFEPAFSILAWIASRVGFSYSAFAATLVAIALGIKLKLILEYTHWSLAAVICYIASFYFLHEYTQVRLAVAIAFGLLATFAWSARRDFAAIVWLLIAATFQSSVIALAVGFAVVRSMYSVSWLIVSILMVMILVSYLGSADPLSMLSTVNPLIIAYVENTDQADQPTILSAANVITVLIITISLSTITIKNPLFWQYLLMTLLSIIFFGLFYDIPVFSSRLLEMFSVFTLFLSFYKSGDAKPSPVSFAALSSYLFAILAFWAFRNAIEHGLVQ